LSELQIPSISKDLKALPGGCSSRASTSLQHIGKHPAEAEMQGLEQLESGIKGSRDQGIKGSRDQGIKDQGRQHQSMQQVLSTMSGGLTHIFGFYCTSRS